MFSVRAVHTSSQCLQDECIALWYNKLKNMCSALPIVSARQPSLFSCLAFCMDWTEDVSGQFLPRSDFDFGLTC